ncbi:MAG TPA: C25 family cysteine peptidase, partial [Bacteroidales bacterium]|nr:C25 family cysteine peptidase [Bacteroidales bacterium]
MKKIYILLLIMMPLFVLAGSFPKPHSVLASGKWYKISVYRSGIHRITYENFLQMGFDPSTITPAGIRIFGNGGGMLPEKNGDQRVDDLMENSIRVVDGGDGTFGPGDYVLFYGESPDTWTYNPAKLVYNHTKNLYSDSVYYFVTVGTETGKRITDEPSNPNTPVYTSGKFRDYAFHDLDSLNLIKSGKTWVGEVFSNINNTHEFPFFFPDIDSLTAMKVTIHMLARSFQNNPFKITDNNVLNDTIIVPPGDQAHEYIFCRDRRRTLTVSSPSTDYRLRITFELPTPSSTGWLDYIEINCFRNLVWNGPQMSFRDPNTLGKCSEFRMKSTHPGIEIWDVSKKDDVKRILTVSTDSTERFRVLSDSVIQEFVAFDGSDFYPVSLSGPVQNQDLHAIEPASLVIVTDPLFRGAAERLAAFHREKGLLSVTVVDLPEIYDEFGCGRREPSAIRDFVRMIYTKSDSAYPGYLLLMGDGTYDPKNRLPGNNNFIPTF